MKIYSIWRGGRGRGRGSVLLVFFPFFPGLPGHDLSRRSGAAASPSRSTGAGREHGHIHGGLEDGTNNPPWPTEKHRGTHSEDGAAILHTLRKAAVGDETPPSSCAGDGSLTARLHPPGRELCFPSRGCRQRAGSEGLPAPGPPSPPHRAHHPSPGLPCGSGNDHRPGNGAGWRCNASRIY